MLHKIILLVIIMQIILFMVNSIFLLFTFTNYYANNTRNISNV